MIDIWHRYSPWQVGAARNQEERNMLRIMHHVCGPALPAALLLIGMTAMGITDAAAEGSPEARQACTPDAMRLCSEFTSDVSQTTKCMMAKRAQLSPECRAAMAHGTSHRAYRHYYRHYGHSRTAIAADFLIYLPERKYAQLRRLALRSGSVFGIGIAHRFAMLGTIGFMKAGSTTLLSVRCPTSPLAFATKPSRVKSSSARAC